MASSGQWEFTTDANHKIKPPLILQPGPAALTLGLAEFPAHHIPMTMLTEWPRHEHCHSDSSSNVPVVGNNAFQSATPEDAAPILGPLTTRACNITVSLAAAAEKLLPKGDPEHPAEAQLPAESLVDG